ncbi:MAG: hypothetical protein AABY05_03450 [Nanoarchaeota archaeon]
MKRGKDFIYFMFCLLFILFFIRNSSAYGVGSSNWPGNPLYLMPGDRVVVNMTVQNVDGSGENVTLRARIGENPIARLTDGDPHDYFIPFGVKDMDVSIELYVPQNVSLGQTYDILVYFREVPSGPGGGTVSITGEIGKRLPIIVGEQPEPQSSPELEQSSFIMDNLYWFLGLIVLIVAVVTIIVVARKRKNTNNY